MLPSVPSATDLSMMLVLAAAAAVWWTGAIVMLWLNLRAVPHVDDASGSGSVEGDHLPSLSVVIPARNEEREIERCIRGFLQQDYPSLEIVVVDDQSSDGTGRIVERLSEEDPRLRVIQGSSPPPGWLGKPWALQQGGQAAGSELLLFCDADVIYRPGALRAIVQRFLTRGVDGLAILPHFEMRGFWEHVLMMQLPFTAFCLLPIFLSNRIQKPILGLGGGPGNLLWRRTWQRIGAHESLKQAVIDDIGLMRSIRRGGGRTEIARAGHLVSVRMYHGFREVVRGFSKNAYHAVGATIVRAVVIIFLGIAIHLLPFVMLGHALLIALSGTPLETAHWLAIFSCGAIAGTRSTLFLQLGERLDNALLGHPLMAIVWIGILAWSAWRVGIRRRLEWRGRGYDSGFTRPAR